MAYIDGFVMAVPTANKQKFLDYVREFDPIFLEFGATRVLECWGDDVPMASRPTFIARWKRRTTRRWCSRGSNGRTRPPAMPA